MFSSHNHPWMKPKHLPDDIEFEQWVYYVFDHPVANEEWRWQAWWWHDEESDEFQHWNDEANPERTLEFLTRFFQNPDDVRERFTPAQIDQGLNFIVSPSCSNHMFCLHESRIPWERRRSLIEAMVPLYERLMGPVYDDPKVKNFACYMWWDVIPLHGKMDSPDGDRMDDAVLWVFEAMVATRWTACLESVLHGLGHWHLYLEDRVEPIVDRILARTDLSKEMREYARLARRGMVQ